MKNFSLVFLLIAFSSTAPAQPQTNLELATQYFSTQEYDKAVVYYEKHYETDPYSGYAPFLKCLLLLKEYNKAEKLVKKQIKLRPADITLLADLGAVYLSEGNTEKSKQQFEKAIKSLSPDINQIIVLGNAFIQMQNADFALETYLAGRKLMRGEYGFNFEIAELYSQRGEHQKMMNEYLDLLESGEQYYPNIQAIFQNKLHNDLTGTISELLRTGLLKRIQRPGNAVIFNDMLYWLFIQEKDFESAFIQAKALDRRLNEMGSRMLNLGRTCVSNNEYKTADKCFRYIVGLGETGPNYIPARIEMVNAAYQRITNDRKPTREELLALEKEFETTLNEIGKNAVTAGLISSYAHLEAFYLDHIDQAISLLQEAINYGNLSSQFKAECKLELGDIYIFKGEMWEAALLYGQVDKDFKHDPIGREAKFRNARLSYYLGEFEWAAAQLNVLKAATSQLISNDALSLSLLIMDNTGLDSITDPLLIYSRADLLEFRNHDQIAITTLDSILSQYPAHSLTDEVWYKKATIYLKMDKADSAAHYFEQVFDKYPDDILADDALYQMASLYQKQMNDPSKALQYFELLLTKYPGSLFAVDARRQFRILRGDKL